MCTLCLHNTLNKISIIFDVRYIFTDVPSDVQCELDIDVAGQFVLSWKQHLVRCVNQDYRRTSVLRNLQPDEVLIIMDWAMKFLPISFREKQSEWFGQKGINWHISVCIFRGDDNLLKVLKAFL